MKSERRHELEQNELADWLADVINTIKQYRNAILAVLILAIAAGGGYAWWTRQSAAAAADGWDQFYSAFAQGNLADFDQIAEQYPGTHLGHWAAAIAGDLHLNIGCNLLFVNKANANQELRHAVDHYTTVRKQSRRGMLLERATYGLARALESQGDLEQAIQRYEDTARTWPNGTYAAAAGRRADKLKLQTTKQWYDRFAKFDPKPAYTDEPGTPGEHPAFDLDSLPEDGPIFQPGMMMDLEEKSTDDEPPVDTPPVDTPPAEDVDADEPKPDDSVEPVETPVETSTETNK